MVTGENQPKTSSTLATSDTIILFVTVVLGNDSAIVRRNSSVDMFNCLGVFIDFGDSLDIASVSEFLWDFFQRRRIAGVPLSE